MKTLYKTKEEPAFKIENNDLKISESEEREYDILRLRDLPDEEKPKEKLMKYGPKALSSSELLSIVFGVGTKKEELSVMTNRILSEYGDKPVLNQTNPKKLMEALDIPENKASQLIACFDLGRRFFQDQKTKPVVLRNAKQAHSYLKDMGKLPKEHLRGLYLNNHYRLIHDEVLAIGSVTANIIHPREVFKPALEHSASAIILAHNHPSGSIKPSSSDIEITEQIIKAGEVMGINLLDHIIIGKNRFSSIPVQYY